MKSEQNQMVREFLVAMGLELAPMFALAKVSDAELVANLIEEELDEYERDDAPESELDALVDLAYVTHNGLLLLGLPVEAPVASAPQLLTQYALTRQVLRYVRPLCQDRCGTELNKLLDATAYLATLSGYDFDGAFKVVHAANMSKFWTAEELAHVPVNHTYKEARGTTKYVVRRADGKIVKPPSFKAPSLAAFVGDAEGRRHA